MMKTILFVHGFGVGPHADGLFDDIAQSLKGYDFTYSDLNNYDDDGNIIVVGLEAQKAELQKIIDGLKATDEITLICHSLGCLTASIADLSKVQKVIFLAPAVTFDTNRTIARYKEKPNAVIDLQGISVLPRSNGTTTKVLPEYWPSRSAVDVDATFGKASLVRKLVIVQAGSDEIIDNSFDFSQRLDIQVIESADHNFTGTSRGALIELLRIVV